MTCVKGDVFSCVFQQSQEEWRLVYIVAAGVSVLGFLVYIVLGSGELQSWAAEELMGQELDVHESSFTVTSLVPSQQVVS